MQKSLISRIHDDAVKVLVYPRHLFLKLYASVLSNKSVAFMDSSVNIRD
jgi:hypothetical protein